MIRSILFPLAEGTPSHSARDFALWLARIESCHVQILGVVDIKAFEIPVLGTPDGFMPTVVAPPVQESRSLLEEMAAAVKEQVERLAADCAAQGLSCSTDIRTGVPGEVIVGEATAHDLVVMGRRGYTRPGGAGESVDPLVQLVIRGSVRPVLVSGREFPPAGDIRRVMVAFDGSAHAARALQIAAHICIRPAVECLIVSVAATEEEGEATLAPAESYMYLHGLTPRKHVAVGTRASEILCDLVTAQGADIMVMGAYGHSPIREVLFGSTTEHILRQCGCTVILHS